MSLDDTTTTTTTTTGSTRHGPLWDLLRPISLACLTHSSPANPALPAPRAHAETCRRALCAQPQGWPHAHMYRTQAHTALQGHMHVVWLLRSQAPGRACLCMCLVTQQHTPQGMCACCGAGVLTAAAAATHVGANAAHRTSTQDDATPEHTHPSKGIVQAQRPVGLPHQEGSACSRENTDQSNAEDAKKCMCCSSGV